MKLFIASICYTNNDKGIFLSFYFFWSNIMTYIKCFLWQYFICHQIWTCPITIVLVIFLTTQNMTMLLLTTRWPIMIHQSNLRLNNPKEMNFCLCVFDPVISLCTYAFALLTHTKDASWDICSKQLDYFFNPRNSFKFLNWKF